MSDVGVMVFWCESLLFLKHVMIVILMRPQDSWVEDCLSVVFASKIINAS